MIITTITYKILENKLAKDCLLTMGETSENVASRYNIPREKQDQMGYESQMKVGENHLQNIYTYR